MLSKLTRSTFFCFVLLTVGYSKPVSAAEIKGYLETYIPFPEIENPIKAFSRYEKFRGDGSARTTPDKHKTRFWQEFTAKVYDGEMPKIIFNKGGGTATGIEPSGATVSALVSTSGLAEHIISKSPSFISLQFKASASNPLLTAPTERLRGIVQPIDYDIKLDLTRVSSSKWDYKLTGKHDGFPAFNYFLNNKLIFGFVPTTPDAKLLSPILGDQIVRKPSKGKRNKSRSITGSITVEPWPPRKVNSDFKASSPLDDKVLILDEDESSIDIKVEAMAELLSTLEIDDSDIQLASVESKAPTEGVEVSQKIEFTFSGGTFGNPSNPSSGLTTKLLTDDGDSASISHMVGNEFSLGASKYTITAIPTVNVSPLFTEFNSPASQSFSFTVKKVPEPLTILGTATALGIGAAFKRKYSKQSKKAKQKAA